MNKQDMRPTGTAATAILLTLSLWIVGTRISAQSASEVAAANAAGWQIPASAADEKNPLSPTPAVLKKGREIFVGNCQMCHGPAGKGDGPYGDPKKPPADLTAAENSDGVLFYKVWNGHKDPMMPAFKTILTKDELWPVVTYVKTLHKPAGAH
jgi:mono/diheme cytochrome c family protein